jgi:hypothetical protein
MDIIQDTCSAISRIWQTIYLYATFGLLHSIITFEHIQKSIQS